MENVNNQNDILKHNIIQINAKMREFIKNYQGPLKTIVEASLENSNSYASIQAFVRDNLKLPLNNSNDDYVKEFNSLSLLVASN
jgi:hypothetical protein